MKSAAGALLLAFSLLSVIALPVSAQELSEYFQFAYDPVTFDKNEITGGEVFHANVAGRAFCTADLPMSPSEATITSEVVAVHKTSGATVTLNTGYTVTIKPFPSKKDETAEISQDVPLQFPAQAESGEYDVLGKIVKAQVKVMLAPVEVTSFLPQEQNMGTVKYTAVGKPEPLTATGTPLQSDSQGEPAPSTANPTAALSPEPPAGPEVPWWVWPVVALAGVTTIFNVIWFIRHRR